MCHKLRPWISSTFVLDAQQTRSPILDLSIASSAWIFTTLRSYSQAIIHSPVLTLREPDGDASPAPSLFPVIVNSCVSPALNTPSAVKLPTQYLVGFDAHLPTPLLPLPHCKETRVYAHGQVVVCTSVRLVFVIVYYHNYFEFWTKK